MPQYRELYASDTLNCEVEVKIKYRAGNQVQAD